MRLFYGITFSTESDEIIKLVDLLKNNTTDDIVVQYDTTKAPKETIEHLEERNIKLNAVIFDNDFSKFKNELNAFCQNMGADYIFQLDADELINEFLIKNINEIISLNERVEVFYLPRINTVSGIDESHISKWKWNLDSKGRINYPDLQGRIYKSHLRWENKVHERIGNVKEYSIFPFEEEYSIVHAKTIKRQEFQNNFYDNM